MAGKKKTAESEVVKKVQIGVSREVRASLKRLCLDREIETGEAVSPSTIIAEMLGL
jgi:hypothetical protein